MKQLTTFDNIMKILPPGSLMYDVISFGDEGNWEVVFFIKEDQERLLLYKEKPQIEVIAGLVKERNVIAVVVTININQHDDLLYETWLNYHSELGNTSFACLAKQDKITICLLNEENNKKRTLSIANGLKDGINSYIKIIKGSPNWEMEDFDRAKEAISLKYPSIKKLYTRLKDSIVI